MSKATCEQEHVSLFPGSNVSPAPVPGWCSLPNEIHDLPLKDSKFLDWKLHLYRFAKTDSVLVLHGHPAATFFKLKFCGFSFLLVLENPKQLKFALYLVILQGK